MPNNKIQSLTVQGVTYDIVDNTSGYITGITSSDVTGALGFTPYNSTNPNGYTTNTGTITSVKTTAGAHTTINVSSGAANFNVPTKTSHLTNDSDFISARLVDVVYENNEYTLTDATKTDIATWINNNETVILVFGDKWYMYEGYYAFYDRYYFQSIKGPYFYVDNNGVFFENSGFAYDSSIPQNISDLYNDAGYITSYTETDPVFSASPAGGIEATDITNWNGKTNTNISYDSSSRTLKKTVNGTTSDVVDFGTAAFKLYTTTVTSDGTNLPTSAAVASFVEGKGYITGYTETDPTVPAWAKAANKPSYTFSEISSTPSTLSGYGITNAYTKTEIDGLVAGVLHYKGTKASVANLPSTGNVTGDVWHITADGSEYAWDGTIWQELGTAVDLSGYATKATTLAGYEISDAKIENGTIILGNNSITPLTSYTETDPVFSASAAYGISLSDISNWNAKSDTDEKVKAVSVTNDGSIRYIIFGSNSGNAETKYYHSGLGYSVTSGNVSTFILGNNTNKGRIRLLCGGGDTFFINIEGTPSGNRTLTLPDKTGTVALTSDIPTVPTNISAFINDSGYLTSYTETDPVFSASAAASITSTDISNWNAKVSDDKTWNGVALDKNTTYGGNFYVPNFSSTSSSSVQLTYVTDTPSAGRIARYGNPTPYLYSTTPSANDNSTKVATTAYVDAAIPDTSSFLTLADLPIYDGTVV